MKNLLLILILTLSFQYLAKADDIRDFQIEGMSIGDSALDYFSEEYIKKKKKYYYPKSKKFFRINTGKINNLETYEAIQFQLLSNDKNYIIYALSGLTLYENNIEDCFKLKNTLVEEMKSLFPTSENYNYKKKHDADKTGKSVVDRHDFILESGGLVLVKCSDWSEEMHSGDKLTVGILSQELLDFVQNEAY